MRFSIVIPTYQRKDLLVLCLNGLEHYFLSGALDHLGHQVDVVVTDDAHDASVQRLLGTRYPWCQYLLGPQRGPAANRNHGACLSTGDWIVFIDDDCLPQPGWIEAYATLANQFDLLEGQTSATGVRTRVDEECPVNEIGGLLWSCNFAIRRDAFLALSGFNEGFPAPAMEDVEFNLRVNNAGYSRTFVSDALVLHPWRLRKGRSFVEAHSKSVAKFVFLHPEKAKNFSMLSQLFKLARMLKSKIMFCAKSEQFAGLTRALYLDFCSCFMTWNAVRQVYLR